MNRTPTTAGATRTRARILATALDLFNRFGTADVTTNQIAAEAGISPGNLYYWFTDKQAIIRELFAGLSDANLALWSDAENLPEGPDGLLARLADATVLTRRYRFFSRDLLALVHADPVLRAAYVANRGRRVASFRTLAQRWRETGIVGPVSDERLDDLVQVVWIVSEAWLPFAELENPDSDLPDGGRLLRAVIEPYLAVSAARDVKHDVEHDDAPTDAS